MRGDSVARFLERPRSHHGIPRLDPSHGKWRNRLAFASLEMGDGFVVRRRLRVDSPIGAPTTLRVQVAGSALAEETTSATVERDIDGARSLLARVASLDPKRWDRVTRDLAVRFEVVAEDATGAIAVFTPEDGLVRIFERDGSSWRRRDGTTGIRSVDDDERVSSLEDLALFIRVLRDDLAANEAEWENPTLERFLEALAAVADGLPQRHRNLGLPPPEPSWATMADLLASARIYE